MPSITKKRLLRMKCKRHMLTSVQSSFSVQTTGSVFVETFESVRRKTKLELKRMKIIGCFLNGCGGYESNLVSFKNFQLKIFPKTDGMIVYQEF